MKQPGSTTVIKIGTVDRIAATKEEIKDIVSRPARVLQKMPCYGTNQLTSKFSSSGVEPAFRQAAVVISQAESAVE